MLLVSCASPVPTMTLVKPVESESIVYVYRPRVLANSMVSPELIVNDEKISEIDNGSFQIFHLPAKSHVFSLNVDERYLGDKTIKLNTKSNQLYFLKLISSLKFQKNKPYIRHLYLKQVSEPDAYAELLQLVENELPESRPQVEGEAQESEAAASEASFSILKTNNPFQK